MSNVGAWIRRNPYDGILLLLFLLSLPLVNPWVHGDGVGYYSYARALAVEHNLNFEEDWRHGNPNFRVGRVDAGGKITPGQYTRTGHLDNHFSVGPGLVWLPFLTATHILVSSGDRLGLRITADGYSWPYMDTMAVVTACAGFAGLLISFHLARKYFPDRWAFLATLGIWWASSLPVYMYFNPSWSHAHSAFGVALFLWYWDHTAERSRSVREWVLLGLIGGLMIDIYYPNGIMLLALPVEFLFALRMRKPEPPPTTRKWRLLCGASAFLVALFCGLLPTFITKRIIYGSALSSGYSAGLWNPARPQLGRILFSSDHGLFSWTPLLLLACIGLLLLVRRNRRLGFAVLACSAVFYYLIASYFNWDGISSFGNRFFISLTSVFILGLTALLAVCEKLWRSKRVAFFSAGAVVALFGAWNFGLMLQWGLHLIPDRGPVSWRDVASNQLRLIPEDLGDAFGKYLSHRANLMQTIEERDTRQLQPDSASGALDKRQSK